MYIVYINTTVLVKKVEKERHPWLSWGGGSVDWYKYQWWLVRVRVRVTTCARWLFWSRRSRCDLWLIKISTYCVTAQPPRPAAQPALLSQELYWHWLGHNRKGLICQHPVLPSHLISSHQTPSRGGGELSSVLSYYCKQTTCRITYCSKG